MSFDTIFQLDEHLSKTGNNMEGLRRNLNALRMLRYANPMFSRMCKNGSIDGRSLADYATKGVRNTFLEVLRESRQHSGCRDPRDLLYSRIV